MVRLLAVFPVSRFLKKAMLESMKQEKHDFDHKFSNRLLQ